ncbi:MAG TPA: 16S rRNA (cytosine(1402)-N(4))-methyltransferase RsmH [Gemmatimonadales bacterium]|nr:16S rRNA (cytosine(1402)-N(4))-methyltransferase RsmH [Gemmatimonadales bacterium]
MFHHPVLLSEILALGEGATRVVDGTLGDGGHSAGFIAAGASVLGIDRDPEAIRRATERVGSERLTTVQGSTFDADVLERVRGFHPDLILLDLGVSSRQLDDDALGFSFRPGAALDMRMSGEGSTAAEILNEWPVEDLATVFGDWGDERKARPLAREVARRRSRVPMAVSDDLVNAIRSVLGPRSGPPDFARIFQALRIAVNGELDGLAEALPALRDALVTEGRLLVISYHSGEDRIVKHAFQEWAKSCICPPELPLCRCRGRALGILEPRKPVRASETEVNANPRARSATLRGFRTAR